MSFVCVTGMHRGGTSVLARAVHALGVDLGPERFLLHPDDDNPLGYWEDNRFVQLDDQLLGFLGGWWHQPPALDDGWAYDWQLEPFRVWGAQLVADRAPTLDAGRNSGFKDPRLCLLLPFWRTVVGVDHVVLAVRDPREVVASLTKRDGFDPEWSARLWIRYTASAIVNAPAALAVRHDDWFGDVVAALERVAAHLGQPAPAPVAVEGLRAFVTSSLRRSRPDPGGADVLDHAGALYDRIVSGPVDALVPEMRAALDELGSIAAGDS